MVEGRGGGTSEHSAVKQWALSDPGGFQPLIDVLTTVVTQFLDHQVEAGAEAVQLFDTWARPLSELPASGTAVPDAGCRGRDTGRRGTRPCGRAAWSTPGAPQWTGPARPSPPVASAG